MGKGTSGFAVMTAAAGAYLAYAGVRDVPVIDGLRDMMRGTKPAGSAKGVDVPDRATTKQAGKLARGLFDGADAAGGNIVPVAGITGGVAASIAPAVTALLADARADGVNLGGGGHRSVAAQAALRLKNGCPDLTSPSSSCRVPTAPVVNGQSHSQHTLGLAIDFSQDGGPLKASGFAWLQANAARYGLKNLPGERWHWSTTGK